VAVKFRE